MMGKEISVTEDLINEAKGFAIFRNKIKSVLSRFNLNYDKFTITKRDAFDGFIAEKTFVYFLEKDYNLRSEQILRWIDANPLTANMIDKINNNSEDVFSEGELETLKKYFYDKWDLRINDINIDIKTAATHLIPQGFWTYGIPKIQIEKAGKDYIVLNYLIYNKNPKIYPDAKPVKCILIGCISVQDVKKYPITTSNEAAGHDYQVKNYETKISDYKKVDIFLK